MLSTGTTTLLLLLAVTAPPIGAVDDLQTQATDEILGVLEAKATTLRPSVDNEPTNVKVQTYVRNMDVDDVKMKVLLDLTFRMYWTNPYLAFKKTYAGVDHVVLLKPKLSWLPDAFFKNAFTTQLESIHPESYLRVYPDGNITYSTRLSVNLNCPMNLARFPHDTQQCIMQIASYGYTTRDLILKWKEEKPTEIGDNLQGGRFTLDKFETGTCHSKTSTGDYSCVQVSVVVRRDFRAYVIEWYLPTIFLVIVAWFSFFIPFEQFLGRLLLTLVPLIALCSYAHTFTQALASVPYVRAFDVFTGISLIIIFLTLVHIIVCYIRGIKPKPGDVEVGSAEEGGKPVDGEELSGFRQFLQKISNNLELLSRTILVGVYALFLFLYFVAYCGTG